MNLVRRGGQIREIEAEIVREGDEFSYQKGLEKALKHVESLSLDRENKPITHVYAIARFKEGGASFLVLSKPQVDKFRARSKAANNGPWVTDYEMMAKKTAIRRLYTLLPKSIEMATAIGIDEALERGRPQSEFYDDTVIEEMKRKGMGVPVESKEVIDETTGEVKRADQSPTVPAEKLAPPPATSPAELTAKQKLEVQYDETLGALKPFFSNLNREALDKMVEDDAKSPDLVLKLDKAKRILGTAQAAEERAQQLPLR